jgi:hypothetical protein
MKELLLITFLAILSGHCRNVKRGGVDFNTKRAAIGLPLLDSSWVIVDDMEGNVRWAPAHLADSQTYHSKLIKIRDGKIKREENLFVGTQKYKTIDGTFSEELFISCDFDENENVSYWDCYYRGRDHEFGWKISRVQVDSILSRWKVMTR